MTIARFTRDGTPRSLRLRVTPAGPATFVFTEENGEYRGRRHVLRKTRGLRRTCVLDRDCASQQYCARFEEKDAVNTGATSDGVRLDGARPGDTHGPSVGTPCFLDQQCGAGQVCVGAGPGAGEGGVVGRCAVLSCENGCGGG